MTILSYIGLFFCNAASTFAVQKYGRENNGAVGLFFYAAVTGGFSMAVFFCLTGFSLVINTSVLLYALLFAAICICAYFTQLSVYRYMGVAEVGVFTSGGNLILSAVVGMLLFAEELTPISALRILLMLGTVFLLFYRQKSKRGTADCISERPFTATGLLLCLGYTVVLCATAVLSKYIAADPDIADSNDVFFFTNCFIFLFSLITLLVLHHGHVGETFTAFAKLPASRYATVFLNTAASNFASLLGVWILATGDMIFYVPVSGALQILAAEAVAVLMLRERPGLLPVLLTVAVTLLGFFG